MVTGTRARSYQEMVEALAEEGLPALQDTLAELAPEDWQRPTLLRPPEPDKPPWTVLQLAAHYDVFMGLTMPLVAEPQAAQPVVDRASFYIWVSDRSKVSPVIYQYIVDHAQGHTPASLRGKVAETFSQALEAIRTTPPDTIGPGFFGPMRLDEFVATRLVETQVHGLDLTDALAAPPLAMPRVTTMAAEVLDEVLARRAVPGRPADLQGDDLAFIRAAAGSGEHPDPRLPVVG
jgi:Mycothiol maleylpyruvate isomerase N-terminal domain